MRVFVLVFFATGLPAQWDARLAYLGSQIRVWADPEAVTPPPQEGRPVFTQELYYDNILDTLTDAVRATIRADMAAGAKKQKLA